MQHTREITSFLQEHILVVLLFVILSIGLFLGDGKQALIDVYGAAAVLCLYVVAATTLKRQHQIPRLQIWIWSGLILYLGIRSVFSDDVGYSVYSFVRYVDAFVLYYLFVSYSTKNTVKIFLYILLLFSLAVFICVVPLTLSRSSPPFLPLMNLLYLNYGHNHAADIFLIAFPVSSVLWLTTHKRKYLWCTVILIIGSILSFARVVLFLEALFVTATVTYGFLVAKKINKPLIILNIVVVVAAIVIVLIPYSRFARISVIFPKFMKPPVSLEARGEYWRQAIASIRERPFFGSGPGTFYLQSRRLQSKPNEYSWFAHSSVLEYVSETGILGLALMMGLVSIIAYGVVPKKLNCVHRVLLSALSLVIFQSLVDYNLDYLIVWLLLWATIGVLYSRVSAVTPSRIHTPPSIVCIFLLISFYVANLFLFYGGKSFKNSSVYTFVCAYDLSCVRSLLSPDNKSSTVPTSSLEQSVRFFHRKNPEVLVLLASYFQSVGESKKSYDAYFETLTLDPQDSVTFEEYVTLLLDKKRYDDLLPVVELLTASISKDRTRDINFLKMHWETLYPCFTADTLLWSHNQLVYSYQAKSLYYAGLCLIKKNMPDEARELLRIAVDAREGWSNIYLDYAALSEWSYRDTKEAERSIDMCEENINSRRHCASYDNRPLPKTSLTDQTVVFVKQ